jgi:hypothetical protein
MKTFFSIFMIISMSQAFYILFASIRTKIYNERGWKWGGDTCFKIFLMVDGMILSLFLVLVFTDSLFKLKIF